jgi:membrane protease YdiL (CAAX protease family)
MKWIAPSLAYLAVGLGLLVFYSAWGALLGFHAALLISLLIARPNMPLKTLLTNRNFKWIFLSVFLCGASGIALYFLWDIFGFASNLPAQVASLGLNASNWSLFIAYFALVNPFLEEYFWRGWLGDKRKSLHISDFLYAGFHGLVLIGRVRTGSILFGLSVLVLAGWFWRQIAREDGGLLAPLLGHMAADLTILLTVREMVT